MRGVHSFGGQEAAASTGGQKAMSQVMPRCPPTTDTWSQGITVTCEQPGIHELVDVKRRDAPSVSPIMHERRKQVDASAIIRVRESDRKTVVQR